MRAKRATGDALGVKAKIEGPVDCSQVCNAKIEGPVDCSRVCTTLETWKNAGSPWHLWDRSMLIFAQVWCAYACKTQSTVEKWPDFRKVTRILKKFAMSMCNPQISLYLGCGRHRSGGIYYYSWGVFCACSPPIVFHPHGALARRAI